MPSSFLHWFGADVFGLTTLGFGSGLKSEPRTGSCNQAASPVTFADAIFARLSLVVTEGKIGQLLVYIRKEISKSTLNSGQFFSVTLIWWFRTRLLCVSVIVHDTRL